MESVDQDHGTGACWVCTVSYRALRAKQRAGPTKLICDTDPDSCDDAGKRGSSEQRASALTFAVESVDLWTGPRLFVAQECMLLLLLMILI